MLFLTHSYRNINPLIVLIMKTLKYKYLVIIISSFILISGCSKKDDKEVSKFVGNYVISESKLAADLVIPTVEFGDYTLNSGTDITEAIQMALLNAITCASASDAYVELREDNSMFLSCKGADPINAGTWAELTPTSIQLNMNATALPPVGFSITVTDVVLDANGLTGKTIIPIPAALVGGMIAPVNLSPDAPAIFVTTISLKFMKK